MGVSDNKRISGKRLKDFIPRLTILVFDNALLLNDSNCLLSLELSLARTVRCLVRVVRCLELLVVLNCSLSCSNEKAVLKAVLLEHKHTIGAA